MSWLAAVATPCLTSAVLLQIWLAGMMPFVAFAPLTALMGSAAIVNACKFYGALNSKLGQTLWRSWQDFLGLLGIAMLPQVTCVFTAPFISWTHLPKSHHTKS